MNRTRVRLIPVFSIFLILICLFIVINDDSDVDASLTEDVVDRGDITRDGTVRIVAGETSKLTVRLAVTAGAYMTAVSGEDWVVYDTERGTGLVIARPTNTGLYDFVVHLFVPGYGTADMPYRILVVDSLEPDLSWITVPVQSCVVMPVIVYSDDGSYTIVEGSV